MDVRKYCTRCNRGIYTSWRTLDDKKYYHPHCFTCVDCGVILESAQEFRVATATPDEVYCGRCYNERFSPSRVDQQRKPDDYYGTRAANATVIHENSPSRYGLCKLPDEDNNVNILFSSHSPYLLLRNDESFIQPDQNANGAIGNINKKKVKSRNNKEMVEIKIKTLQKKKSTIPSSPMEQSSSSIYTESERLVQKGSRIPRPTSAQSKKSLTATSAVLTTKSKSNRSQIESTKSYMSRPPQSPACNNAGVTPKMQRSISLHQARFTDAVRSVEGGNSSSANTKSNRSSSQCNPRPRSALSSSREQKSILTNYQQTGDNQCVRSSMSKRQCAASFSLRRKKDSKTKQQTRKNNVEHPVSFSNDAYPQLKGGIPSTQAILTAIRREGSDILKLKSSSRIQLRNSESYHVHPVDRNSNLYPTLPKRSFNMTFECPICISSLVPGSCSNETGCPDGTGQCRNVVTPCGHLFHGKCMDYWLKSKGNKRCPICSAICLPETLQPVYLECNLCADLNPKAMYMPIESSGFSGIGKGMEEITNASFRTLRSEYELLKAKYNAILAENHNYSLNATLANSLQSAYDMECRNRLQLQWENRKLLMKLEDLKNARDCAP